MTNVYLNLSQHVNYFLRPISLSLSSQKQIIAKITTVALAAIFLVDNLHSVTAKNLCGSNGGDDFCLLECLQNCRPPVKEPDCSLACEAQCCNIDDAEIYTF